MENSQKIAVCQIIEEKSKMVEYSVLFSIQLLYEHFEEFNNDNFGSAFIKYFKDAINKDIIRKVFIKYLFEFHFTKDELKKVIMLQEKRMTPEDANMNAIEWEKYNSKRNEQVKCKRRISNIL